MQQSPELKVESVRKIFNDGNHNAFTDMHQFKGQIFLTFRSSPTGHDVSADSSIMVLSSCNGAGWQKVHSFNVPGRDVRDPHFLVFDDTLFIYSGTWLCNGRMDLREHIGYAAWTKDGVNWEGPRALAGTSGYYVWRAAAYGGKAYLCGKWRRHVDIPGDPVGTMEGSTALLQSEDGFAWKEIGRFQEDSGNETAFLFEDDGEIVAVARTRTQARVCRSHPPYKHWHRRNLDRFIGGPVLAKWNGYYLVAGRKRDGAEGPRTVLSWLLDDELHDVAELPSGGDNSYPGIIPVDNKYALLSYYSSHEGSGSKAAPSAIYLAELQLDWK